jgi:hypothetical protein
MELDYTHPCIAGGDIGCNGNQSTMLGVTESTAS